MTQQEFEEKFFELYKQGLSTTDICNQLGENRDRGYSLLRRKGLKSNSYKSKNILQNFLSKLNKNI